MNVPSVLLDFDHHAGYSLRSKELPIRLTVGNTELLGWDSDAPWTSLYAIPFATFGLVFLRQTRRSGRYSLDLDEYGDALLFQMVGDDVLVLATRLDRVVRIPFDHLYEAWAALAHRLREFLTAVSPDLAHDNRWEMIEHDPWTPRFMLGFGWEPWFADYEDTLREAASVDPGW